MIDVATDLRGVGELIDDLGLVTTMTAVVVLSLTVFGVLLAVRVARLLADTYTIKITDNAYRWLLDRIVAVGVVLARHGTVAADVAKEALATVDEYVLDGRHSKISAMGQAFWHAWTSKEASVERSKITPSKVTGVASGTVSVEAHAAGTVHNRSIHDDLNISDIVIANESSHDVTGVEVTSVGKSVRVSWNVNAPVNRALRVQPADLEVTRTPDRATQRDAPAD